MFTFDKKTIVRIVIIVVSAVVLSLFTVLFFFGRDFSVGQMEDRRIFGATYMTMSNPYYQVVDSRLRESIEQEGDVLLSRDAAMSQKRQNEEIQDLIDEGAEVIFLVPVEWDQVAEGLEAAKAAGVYIIVVDTPVEDDSLVSCSIVSDNYDAGVQCAEHLLSVRNSAKILLLEHTTAVSGAERIKGFTDTIEGHEGFEVVGKGESDGQIENAMPVMEGLIAENDDADVVMALNDPSAFGAMAAIEGSKKGDSFLVYGVDGSPEAKDLIIDGVMTATCAQFPNKIAKTAVQKAYDLLAGKKVEKQIVIPVELVTVDNVDLYNNGGWQ